MIALQVKYAYIITHDTQPAYIALDEKTAENFLLKGGFKRSKEYSNLFYKPYSKPFEGENMELWIQSVEFIDENDVYEY